MYIGNGIWDQIKPPEPVTLTVERLYEWWGELWWPMLDAMLSDRKDLHERIKKFKDKHTHILERH